MALLFESTVIEFAALVTVLCASLYLYFTRNFNFWKKYDIPHLEPTPFIGDMKDVLFQKFGISEYLKNIYEQHSDKPYVGIMAFDRPALVLNDLDLVRDVLVKDAHHFVNHILAMSKDIDPVVSRVIIMQKNEKWRHTRSSMTQVFTISKLKKMTNLVVSCMQDLNTYMENVAANGEYTK
ncbi:hypothetical protein ANN_15161 [Periplaneta americana]|uniref:Cytochrome P450 n=1 Tax=Periplaneta americana TaxID=6978 RepID=A0ABQ8SGA8_PERAM|nr:hypothetical protein ANN_15161 [Periplaneta americana]